MIKKMPVVIMLLAVGVLATAARSSLKHSAHIKSRYLPEYTASGDLILAKNFHEWIYVGSPLTANALNDGKAGFPEYHNVYMEPGSNLPCTGASFRLDLCPRLSRVEAMIVTHLLAV
jgi:hypothetical protein